MQTTESTCSLKTNVIRTNLCRRYNANVGGLAAPFNLFHQALLYRPEMGAAGESFNYTASIVMEDKINLLEEVLEETRNPRDWRQEVVSLPAGPSTSDSRKPTPTPTPTLVRYPGNLPRFTWAPQPFRVSKVP